MDKKEAWEFAFGMIKVDGLSPSDNLLLLAEKEICGQITTDKIIKELKEKYKKKSMNEGINRVDPYIYPETLVLKNKLNITDNNELKMAEADFSSVRLKELYANSLNGCCDFKYLCQVHDYIFQDLFKWAGQPRIIDIEKSETVLSGESIEYAHYEGIEEVVSKAIKEMNQIDWLKISIEEKAEQISEGMTKIWKAHPFREGNTRTTIIFIAAFTQQKGFRIDVKLLAQNSEYVRKALVAASSNFTFNGLGDKSNPEYLIRIVRGAIERGNKQS